MSHFYGKLQGGRKEVTRTGHKTMRTVAASWGGAVEVELGIVNGVDWASVYLTPWKGEGVRLRLYEGPVSGPKSSDIDEALRCKTCIAYKNWEPFTNGQPAKEPTAPLKKEKKHGSASV